jgi:hypothetical protein
MYFSPCSAIQAADCSALCCINTEGGKWQSCGFTQGLPSPLAGAEFNGVDGFQVPQPRLRCCISRNGPRLAELCLSPLPTYFQRDGGVQVKLTGEKCRGTNPYVATVHYLYLPQRPTLPVFLICWCSLRHSLRGTHPLPPPPPPSTRIRCDPGASGQSSSTAESDPGDSCAINIRWPSASACSLRVRRSSSRIEKL